jgi:hypothetical protein
MDIANQLANGRLVLGVSQCPACGGKLALNALKQSLEDFRELPTGKVREHPVHICSCGWCVPYHPSLMSNYRSIDTLVGRQPGIELPECQSGHSLAWSQIRRLGNRLDVMCVQFQVKGMFQCNEAASMWIGPRPGFLSKPGIYNSTKAKVLRALWQFKEKGLTFAELRSHTGLTDGQIVGYLKRGTLAQVPLIEKVGNIYQPPNHVVALYQITAAGLQWVQWAMEEDYYGETA